MIPVHQSEKTRRNSILVNHLALLNEYDFTEPHRHNYFEFFYFIKGGGIHKIDFIEFPIEDHSVHIVAPGQVHQMRRELDSEGYVCLFELSALQAPIELEDFLFEHITMDAGEYSPVYLLPPNQAENFKQKMITIHEEARSENVLDKLNLKLGVQSMVVACMKERVTVLNEVKSEYLKFRRLLKENYIQLKKVQDYARLMSMSDRSLNDMVKKQTGQSASEIIYSQIIMEAKRYLHTGMTIKEVAYTLNFEDPAHFSKFFKSQTGISPSDFQNNT